MRVIYLLTEHPGLWPLQPGPMTVQVPGPPGHVEARARVPHPLRTSRPPNPLPTPRLIPRLIEVFIEEEEEQESEETEGSGTFSNPVDTEACTEEMLEREDERPAVPAVVSEQGRNLLATRPRVVVSAAQTAMCTRARKKK